MIAMLAASQGLNPDDPSFWMPLAFMALLFVVIAAGVVLDGFDLGVGILLQLAPAEERGRMMSLLSPGATPTSSGCYWAWACSPRPFPSPGARCWASCMAR